jgi:CrcB protein
LRLSVSGFPLGTLGVNFIGAFLNGAVTEIAVGSVPLHPNLLLFLTVGLCGGFTTFSTFSLETVQLFEKRTDGRRVFVYRSQRCGMFSRRAPCEIGRTEVCWVIFS